jgi:hypothetical protein
MSSNKKPLDFQGVLLYFAVTTGFEPATSGVTGRHSNQLNYITSFLKSHKSKVNFQTFQMNCVKTCWKKIIGWLSFRLHLFNTIVNNYIIYSI